MARATTVRATDVLIDQKGFSIGSAPMIDLTRGGQNGYSPMLKEWVSNQAYVRRQLVAILLEAPGFFQSMPDPDLWVATLRALVELHPRSIEGLNAGLEVDIADDNPIGGGGEMQHEFVNVKQQASEPVFNYTEKYGRPIQTFLYQWIVNGMMHFGTKTPMITTLSEENKRPSDLLSPWYTMSVLFFEPDPTHQKVMKSWVMSNMFPRKTDDILGKRDLTAASELQNLSIPFTGFAQFNMGSDVLAQAILKGINMTNANPHLQPAFIKEIEADVASAATGLKKKIEELGASALSFTAAT
jgi:hypothetical protein